MAVNLPPPNPTDLHPVPGVELGVAMAGVRKANRKDLLVMRLAPGSAVAGVFTRNRFCAAPVALAKKHLKNDVMALVVNTVPEVPIDMTTRPGSAPIASAAAMLSPVPGATTVRPSRAGTAS